MDQQTDIDLDQADEEILTYTVSDEALESAADTEGKARHLTRQSFPCAGYPC
jgi:hypothetical protein